MKPLEIVILIVVVVAFVLAVSIMIARKLKGKSGCDCGGDCAHCACCTAKPKESAPQKSDAPEKS